MSFLYNFPGAQYLGLPSPDMAVGNWLPAPQGSMQQPEGLLGRFARNAIPGAGDMSPQDRRALATQGLLAAGLGVLANNRGGNGSVAIGQGLTQGLLAMNKGADDLTERKQRQQMLARGYGEPAGVREFQAMTEGLSEDEKAKARKIALGLEGRASNAGFQSIKFKGPDQRERIGVFNGRTGQIETPDGLSFDPSSVTPIGLAQPSTQVKIDGIPQADQARIAQVVEAMGSAGYPKEQIDAFVASQLPQGEPTFTPAPVFPRASPTAGVNPFVGPTPGEVSYGEESAKQQAELEALPRRLGLETNAAITQAGGEAAAKAQAERDSLLASKRVDAANSIDLLDAADSLLPKATGSGAGAMRDRAAAFAGVATNGSLATASLKTIAGQLISKMPRMQGPQSDKDVQLYKDMAGDLANDKLPVKQRQAAASTIRRLQEYYTQGRQAPGGPRAGVVEDGYRFKGGDPADPKNWEQL